MGQSGNWLGQQEDPCQWAVVKFYPIKDEHLETSHSLLISTRVHSLSWLTFLDPPKPFSARFTLNCGLCPLTMFISFPLFSQISLLFFGWSPSPPSISGKWCVREFIHSYFAASCFPEADLSDTGTHSEKGCRFYTYMGCQLQINVIWG